MPFRPFGRLHLPLLKLRLADFCIVRAHSGPVQTRHACEDVQRLRCNARSVKDDAFEFSQAGQIANADIGNARTGEIQVIEPLKICQVLHTGVRDRSPYKVKILQGRKPGDSKQAVVVDRGVAQDQSFQGRKSREGCSRA